MWQLQVTAKKLAGQSRLVTVQIVQRIAIKCGIGVLPIGGQVAIYNGYDLPLPFGISFLYSHIEQDQSITNLKVGYGGPANTKIDFLSFDTSALKPTLHN